MEVSRSQQAVIMRDYGKYENGMKQSLRKLMSTLTNINAGNVDKKIKEIDGILTGIKQSLDVFFGSHPDYMSMDKMVKELKRTIIKYNQQERVFAYSDSDVIVFNHVDKTFSGLFGVELNLPKRLLYDLDQQLKWKVRSIFNDLESDSVEDGTEGITNVLRELNRMFDDIAFCNREGIPARVLKNQMIAKFRNLMFREAENNSFYAHTDIQVRLFDSLNSIFHDMFSFELDLPKQEPSRGRGRPQSSGPSDESLEKLTKQGKGPKEDEVGKSRTGFDFHNTCVVLDNLHKRLSALELRMGA